MGAAVLLVGVDRRRNGSGQRGALAFRVSGHVKAGLAGWRQLGTASFGAIRRTLAKQNQKMKSVEIICEKRKEKKTTHQFREKEKYSYIVKYEDTCRVV